MDRAGPPEQLRIHARSRGGESPVRAAAWALFGHGPVTVITAGGAVRAYGAVLAAASPRLGGVPWWEGLGISVASGVLVAVILAAARAAWKRHRIPTGLSRGVYRKSYLDAVLRESRREDVHAIDVLAPRLTPATTSRMISIQEAWKQVNARGGGGVRLLVLDNDPCLKGGAELLSAGIKVRVAHLEMGTEDLSFHLFHARTNPTAIVNFHDERGGKPRDKPIQLNGSAPIQPFRERFDTVWRTASPLETVIARKITTKAGRSSDCKVLWQALNETNALLGLDDGAVDKVLPHLAFSNSCSVVFILGLPGAGKSHVRDCLARKLKAMGVESRELTDYLYAFRDHLHGLMKLEPARGTGFEARAGGAFAVSDERALQPALNALAQAATGSLNDSEVVLVEFARTDIVAALEEFGDIGHRCRIIYVQAPAQLRSERLSSRHEPPESSTNGRSVTFTPSDNHMLPSNVERSIYHADNIDRLMNSPRWRELVFWVQNDTDDGGGRINASLDQFVQNILNSYRNPSQATGPSPLIVLNGLNGKNRSLLLTTST